jgi:hypothetical protein
MTTLARQIISDNNESGSNLLAGVGRHVESTDKSHESISVECDCQSIAPGRFHLIAYQ